MKQLITILGMLLASTITFSQGTYAPAAGLPGTTAIHKDSSIIAGWATGIEINRGYINISDTSIYQNGTNLASYGYSSYALDSAQGTSFNCVSLGDSGIATLTFNQTIINGTGPDFAVFENGFSDNGLELAFVEVSSDGINFVRFPAVSLTQTNTQIDAFGSLDPTNLYNLAGKYRQGFGVPFDLEDIKDSSNIDINNIRFIRIIDVTGSINSTYAQYDSQGNIINDPFATASTSGGFDLDGVAVINVKDTFHLSTIENLPLSTDTCWYGADESGSFVSDISRYYNNYDANYGSWSGFAYSNMRNDTTEGYTNQYSAITAGGINKNDSLATNYAVAYVASDWMNNFAPIPNTINFIDSAAHVVNGFYITNATYAALSMQNGDYTAKKFGGATGNDPDWFKVSIWGTSTNNTPTDTIDYYLADYRFTDNTKDYIVTNWRWVDLSSLGAVKNLNFILSSTDEGAYGMNTPAYFCMDNLSVKKFNLLLSGNMPNITARTNTPDSIINLNNVYANGNYSINYNILLNSDSSVAIGTLNGQDLTIDFINQGQSYLILQANYNGDTITDTIAIGVLPEISGAYEVVHFEDLNLNTNTYWNGSDISGNFVTGMGRFTNYYDANYSSWSGFSYSNINDTETPGYGNQYAAYTGTGLDTSLYHGSTYGVASTFNTPIFTYKHQGKHEIKGLYVTNSTYAALSMKKGDFVGKKFGGAEGNDPDWFKLSVWGKNNGQETDTTEFYLADFRFADNSRDYIVETWQWFDLSSLGKTDSLLFTLSSSDNGAYGMNTPSYFCIDNILITDTAPEIIASLDTIFALNNQADSIIDLTNIFTDTDDIDSLLTYTLISNSNNSIVNATVNNHYLTIDFLTVGTTEIVVEAEANTKTILDTIVIDVKNYVNISENNHDEVTVYPNPAKDFIIIENAENSVLSISDIAGKIILNTKIYTSTKKINLNTIPKGMYFVFIQSEKYSYTEKLIIK